VGDGPGAEIQAVQPGCGPAEGVRQAWNRHTEARDWSWWLENVKSVPDAKLQQEIAECRAEIAAFRKEPDTERQRFQRILDGKEASRPIQRESKDHERDR